MKRLKIRGPATRRSCLGTWITEEQSSPIKSVSYAIWANATDEIAEKIETYFFPLNQIVYRRIADDFLTT